MPKIRLTIDMVDVLAAKLRQARVLASLSTREVEQLLPGDCRVSHATIASYERGATIPSPAVLAALAAVYNKHVQWFQEDGPIIQGIRYRNLKSKTKVGDLQRYEAEAHRWIDAYLRLESALGTHFASNVDLKLPPAPLDAKPQEMAEYVRGALRLSKRDPVRSAIYALKRFGIRTIEVPTDSDIDGFAGRIGDAHVVVLNPHVPSDRARMNALHELMHVLYGDCDTDKQPSSVELSHQEKRAFASASQTLMPSPLLKAAFQGRSMVRLLQFKIEYGISLSAMLYRAEVEKLIPAALAKRMWIEFGRRGWKKTEPGDVRPDRAVGFERLIDGAIISGKLNWVDVERITGISQRELKSRVALPDDLRSEPVAENPKESSERGESSRSVGLRLAR